MCEEEFTGHPALWDVPLSDKSPEEETRMKKDTRDACDGFEELIV